MTALDAIEEGDTRSSKLVDALEESELICIIKRHCQPTRNNLLQCINGSQPRTRNASSPTTKDEPLSIEKDLVCLFSRSPTTADRSRSKQVTVAYEKRDLRNLPSICQRRQRPDLERQQWKDAIRTELIAFAIKRNLEGSCFAERIVYRQKQLRVIRSSATLTGILTNPRLRLLARGFS